MNKFYNDTSIEDGAKRNAAFQTSNALREAISLALNRPQPITYEDVFQYIADLDRDVYLKVIHLLDNRNENKKVKLYKALAEHEVNQGNEVTPVDLINTEIEKYKEIQKAGGDAKAIAFEIIELVIARDYFSPRVISEHKILEKDFRLVERDYFKKKIYEDDSYVDYKLSDKEALRLRLLHPDKPEHILGADMVYEQFDLLKEKVRFVYLQYKVWDNKTLYLNDRVQSQLEKMHKNLCGNGFCFSNLGKKSTNKYRLPYCSAFLRPTSNKASPNPKLISTGYHLPICEAIKSLQSDGKVTKENLKGKSLSHNVFEEGFTSNMLGSRWIDIDEYDKFYDSVGLKIHSNSIRIHAQHVIIPTEEEVYEYQKS